MESSSLHCRVTDREVGAPRRVYRRGRRTTGGRLVAQQAVLQADDSTNNVSSADPTTQGRWVAAQLCREAGEIREHEYCVTVKMDGPPTLCIDRAGGESGCGLVLPALLRCVYLLPASPHRILLPPGAQGSASWPSSSIRRRIDCGQWAPKCEGGAHRAESKMDAMPLARIPNPNCRRSGC
jgi:hypothetical protein